MNRKDFIRKSSLAIFAISTFGTILKGDDGDFKGDCNTTNDILGPFYRPNAPMRSDLTYEGLEGSRILLKGKVFKHDCITPLEKALVEIWHCNAAGEYDNESDDFLQRASFYTNAAGEYAFSTILPGKYLNGQLYRPAHIHYRVREQNSAELISQIYFQGDPHIEKDPWASKDKAKLRIVPIIPENIEGGLSVNFDIYLGKKR